MNKTLGILSLFFLILCAGCSSETVETGHGVGNSTTTSSSTSSPVSTDLSWSEQQTIWNSLHSGMEDIAKKDPDGQKILAFIDKNGTLVDTSKGAPAKQKGTKFSIIMLDATPHADWQAKYFKHEFAVGQYFADDTVLVIRKSSVDPRIGASIALHEGTHALHFIMVYKEKALTMKEHYSEEISAYTPQVRQIGIEYGSPYQAARTQLMEVIEKDIRVRQKAAKNPEENMFASLPDPMISAHEIIDHPERTIAAFGLDSKLTVDELAEYMSFLFMDAALAVLDKHYPKATDALIMKMTFLRHADEVMYGPQ